MKTLIAVVALSAALGAWGGGPEARTAHQAAYSHSAAMGGLPLRK